MVNTEISKYINEAKSRGMGDEEIKNNLRTSGWKEGDIFDTYDEINSKQKHNEFLPPKAHRNIYYSFWDSFEHILMFISMAIMVIAATLLIHTFIDKWIPSSTNLYTYTTDLSYIKWSMAALIVSTPPFTFFFIQIVKRTEKNPAIRTLDFRKVLAYLTIAITFVIAIINIFALVLGFLYGNVTLNFFLHFLNTIGISSLIFAYFLNQIKEDRKAYA